MLCKALFLFVCRPALKPNSSSANIRLFRRQDELGWFSRKRTKLNVETQVGMQKYELKCISIDGCNGSFPHNQTNEFLDKTLIIALDRIEQEVMLRMASIENLETYPSCPRPDEYPPVDENKEFRSLPAHSFHGVQREHRFVQFIFVSSILRGHGRSNQPSPSAIRGGTAAGKKRKQPMSDGFESAVHSASDFGLRYPQWPCASGLSSYQYRLIARQPRGQTLEHLAQSSQYFNQNVRSDAIGHRTEMQLFNPPERS
ncbi:hypothetical protein B0H63DRAFT_443641 [Podospora didyma]|uniref:Uncharacterized protein n=1 Tax=Podospora didyma TaxID=330526 RepID=A0AAE0P505_9PEZI|nr:hypothetical protein B0H63DRAFT_443641 [Podospora didyma]